MKLLSHKIKNHTSNDHEKLQDILARLKQYDETSKNYKIDLLSIPAAVQMILKIFPRKYYKSDKLKEKILRSFVTTIIPGADEEDDNLIKMYNDKYYPFNTYCGYFVFDLNKRSKKLFSNKDFFELSLREKTKVVQSALSDTELARRLYKGAILIAHVSYYGAVYNEERGCPLIYFPGNNEGYSKEEVTYSFAGYYFDRELSIDGQPW
jgi:hypothetical protein